MIPLANKKLDFPGTKSHGQLIKFLLDKYDIPVEDFAKHYLDKSRAVAYNFLKKDAFNREEIALMCALFNLSPTYFGEPADLFATPFNTSYHSNDEDIQCAIYSAREDRWKDYGYFLSEYFSMLNKAIGQAKKSLFLHDYLGKVKDSEHTPLFEKEMNVYFQEIESHLERNRGLKYKRILALPAHEYRPDLNFDQILERIISLLFPRAYAHIVRCFLKFPNQFELYISDVPARPYSFGVIDSTTALTEYDRYDRFGVPKSDILFIESKNSYNENAPFSQLVKAYINDMEHIIQENERSPRRSVFAVAFQEISNQILFNTKLDIDTLENSLKIKKHEVIQDMLRNIETIDVNEQLGTPLHEARVLRQVNRTIENPDLGSGFKNSSRESLREMEDKLYYLKRKLSDITEKIAVYGRVKDQGSFND